jgi:hypothetical protein
VPERPRAARLQPARWFAIRSRFLASSRSTHPDSRTLRFFTRTASRSEIVPAHPVLAGAKAPIDQPLIAAHCRLGRERSSPGSWQWRVVAEGIAVTQDLQSRILRPQSGLGATATRGCMSGYNRVIAFPGNLLTS